MELKENVIEWITGDNQALCTFSQKKYINRIQRMAKKHAPCVEILAENEDGSICAKIPLGAVHLTIYDSKNKGFSTNTEDNSDED